MSAKFGPEKYDFGPAYTNNFQQKKKTEDRNSPDFKEKIKSKSPDFL
jgi:hypothetical protein